MPIFRSIMYLMQVVVNSEGEMRQFSEKLGRILKGGEVIELIGDIGAGKTTFTKGLALGLDVKEYIQSPTFTISRVYAARDDLELRHYDFYRLSDAGIMNEELNESVSLDKTVVVIEWAGLVDSVLPDDRLQIDIETTGEDSRLLSIRATGSASKAVLENITW